VIDTAPTPQKPRRTFTAESNDQLIQLCHHPDPASAKVAMLQPITANRMPKVIRQSRTMVPPLAISSIPQTDFLPVILHPTPVKQEAPPPPVQEKKATAHMRTT
ncbi:hypothetical protein, partial [Acinetobacter baumannii]|uniref:hypothetical protein n=1 Tax=Acinetobacter baumannii TaxID=470 RepID=UPI000E09B96A